MLHYVSFVCTCLLVQLRFIYNAFVFWSVWYQEYPFFLIYWSDSFGAMLVSVKEVEDKTCGKIAFSSVIVAFC